MADDAPSASREDRPAAPDAPEGAQASGGALSPAVPTVVSEGGADGETPGAETLARRDEDAAQPPHEAEETGDPHDARALIEAVRAYDPTLDADLLERAYQFAGVAHAPQKRASGEPYITHPLAVATLLTEIRADPASIATALLHDVVEDTPVSGEEIEREFGAEIAELVDGVTKLTRVEMRSAETKQAENFRKLIVAMAKDVRVILVKLADRLHNMRTLDFVKSEKQKRVALETMEIFAPLAGRIGVRKFREELEDLSFRVLDPDAFRAIDERLRELREETVHAVVELAQTLRDGLAEDLIKAEVYSREKRPYSIWRKMAAKNAPFEELADIYAFRVIVESLEDCYRALGVIHRRYPAIPGEFDDYISAPKPNNYQSIHTAVLGPPVRDGVRQRIEIQIRTRAMHESAERGVAAHWRYKDPNSAGGRVEIGPGVKYDPYAWAQNLVEMLQKGDSAEVFLENTKLELFQDQVFCFTPKGAVVALPKGATPVDFAYALHSDIGDSCVGAVVNGHRRPLRMPLRNGEVVHVLRAETFEPPADWEALAVTGRARAAIRRRIKRIERSEHEKLGRALLEAGFVAEGQTLTDKAVAGVLSELEKTSVEDVYDAIGRSELGVDDVLDTVFKGRKREPGGKIASKSKGKTARPSVVIEGLEPGVAVHMSKCCWPLPGDRIVGLRSPSGAIAVHTIDCDVLADNEEEDWIDLRWRPGASERADSVVRVKLTARNEPGALVDIANAAARYSANITNIKLLTRERDFCDILLDIEATDTRHVAHVLAGLRAARTIIEADRARGE
ncbi:MAG: bifunctional (p)ppGpp synthetase/guanosine-3',5'-bis(diphosphate) 3'-pyrophosphohydrolase [Pseudomonadota bacterium]